MSKGVKLFPAAVAVTVVAMAAAALFLPDRTCAHAPGGDEAEGECLRLAASTTQVGRCRVIGALLHEIGTSHNDVVISGGLEGFVSARACGDLAVLRLRVPVPAPSHVVPLVDAALEACQAGTVYTLQRKPTEATPSNETVVRLAQESGCSRIYGTAKAP
jgi:hypothetical protein